MNSTRHERLLKRIGVFAVFGAILSAAHGFAFYRVFSHSAWTVAVGLLVLVLLAHIGGLCFIYAVLKRGFRHKT
jgi:hypothetical protein